MPRTKIRDINIDGDFPFTIAQVWKGTIKIRTREKDISIYTPTDLRNALYGEVYTGRKVEYDGPTGRGTKLKAAKINTIPIKKLPIIDGDEVKILDINNVAVKLEIATMKYLISRMYVITSGEVLKGKKYKVITKEENNVLRLVITGRTKLDEEQEKLEKQFGQVDLDNDLFSIPPASRLTGKTD